MRLFLVQQIFQNSKKPVFVLLCSPFKDRNNTKTQNLIFFRELRGMQLSRATKCRAQNYTRDVDGLSSSLFLQCYELFKWHDDS